MCFGTACFMANDYLWFLGDPNHSAMRLIYAMNAVIHSSVIFFHSLFLLSANADRIQALASFGTNGHRFFVAVRINAFISLLRHNDIHYARACQVFSIESWKIWFDMSIDFLLFDFRQNVYKWWCDWWKRQTAATFFFFSYSFCAFGFALCTQIHEQQHQWHKNHVFMDWHCCQVESSFHHRMNCCAKQKWKWKNQMKFIDHYFPVYWFWLVGEIEMHRSFKRSRVYHYLLVKRIDDLMPQKRG